MIEWRRVRLDWVVTEIRNTVRPDTLGVDTVFHYSIPTFDELKDGRVEDPSEIGSGKTLLSGGEVLISKLNPRKPRILVAEKHEQPTVCSGEFVVIRPERVETRFLVYLLTSETTRQELDGRVQSVTRSQQRVRPEDITKMWVRLPARDAQARIADHLEVETARIEALIEKKRRMAEVLQERHQGVVEHGLYGGFSTAARRDSGLPEVPPAAEHWGLRRLGTFCGFQGGMQPPKDEFLFEPTSGYVRLLQIRDFASDAQPVYVREGSTSRRCGVNDVLIGRYGGLGETETLFSVHSGKAGAYNVALVKTLPNESLVDRRFLYWLLQDRRLKAEITAKSARAVQSGFQKQDLKNLAVWLPPIPEQREIAQMLDHRKRILDSILTVLERQVGLLTEHRQALITAAVTGELDIAVAA